MTLFILIRSSVYSDSLGRDTKSILERHTNSVNHSAVNLN